MNAREAKRIRKEARKPKNAAPVYNLAVVALFKLPAWRRFKVGVRLILGWMPKKLRLG